MDKGEAYDFHEELRTSRAFRTGVKVRVYEDAILLDTALVSIITRSDLARVERVGNRLEKLTTR